MTQQAPVEEDFTEEEIALLIAGILAGTVVVPNPLAAIGTALLALVPHSVPHALGGRISADVARLVVRDLPRIHGAGEAKMRTSHDNLMYRALYGIQGIKRLVAAIVEPGDESLEEKLDKAIKAEARYFQQHKDAVASREAKAADIDLAAERYGPNPGWHSVLDENTDARCRELHGTNFDITNPPDGLYPGMRDGGNCRCRAGKPF